MEDERDPPKTYIPLLLSAAMTIMGTLVVAATLGLLILWRDFSLVSERQVSVIRQLQAIEQKFQSLDERLTKGYALDVEQQYQINQLVERLRYHERNLPRPWDDQ